MNHQMIDLPSQGISMKSKFVSAALAAVAVVATLASAPLQAQTVFTVSSWVPPAHILSISQRQWCEALAVESSNRMRCNILPRAVTSPPGTYDAIKSGQADISFTVHGYTPGRFTTTQMAEFSFLGNYSEPVSVAFQRMADRHPAIKEEHQGVKVLAVFTHGPGIVYNTKRAITKMDDLSGLKFRVGGGMVNEISKSLGMNVTLKPAPESFELLSTGVMDGTLFPAESVESFKIDRIIKYATTFQGGLYNTSFVFMMNPTAYDKLKPEDKKVVDKLSGEYAARLFGRNWDSQDRKGMAYMQVAGVKFDKADAKFIADVKSKTSALEGKWISDASGKGLKDPAKVLAEFRGEIAKLEK
jgi:TRAP-type transport system periplasmic protein